jgi:hypothetical protein
LWAERVTAKLLTRCRVSLCEFCSALLDFVDVLIAFAFKQEHHHGLAVALARVVEHFGPSLLEHQARACGLDQSVTERASSGLRNRSNGSDHHRRLSVFAAAHHGSVLAEPMVSAEVLDDRCLTTQLRASEQHHATAVDQLELAARRSQRPSSALR